MKKLLSFLKEEDGVTAIEYGLIAALISVVIIAAFGLLSESLENIFTVISDTLSEAADAMGT
jgi:pilus assembly protein Flp/PilA